MAENPSEAIRNAVNTVIERSGMSDYAIARQAGIGPNSIHYYRSGRSEPTSTAIAKMELAMGVERGTIYAEAAQYLHTHAAA